MPNVLTRKLGPAPVWAWAIVGAAAVWFLFLRSPSASGQTTQSPVTASTAGGSGSSSAPPADAGSSADGDLLGQLLQAQQNTIDTLTGAFVGGSGGGAGITSASSTSGQAAVTSGAAPSSVQQTGPAATPTSDPNAPPGTIISPSGTGDPFTGGAPGGTITGDPEHNLFVTGGSDVDPFNVTPTDQGDAVSRYLANQGAVSTFSSSTPVSSPTPITVTPMPAPGHNVAV